MVLIIAEGIVARRMNGAINDDDGGGNEDDELSIPKMHGGKPHTFSPPVLPLLLLLLDLPRFMHYWVRMMDKYVTLPIQCNCKHCRLV